MYQGWLYKGIYVLAYKNVWSLSFLAFENGMLLS